MRNFYLLFFILIATTSTFSQEIKDDFEGNGNISTWYEDNCNLDINFTNPHKESINTSNTVLKYSDVGGQYANVGYNNSTNFDLSTNYVFTLKVYIPSSGITGSQTNQISLKLQDGNLSAPWSTQSEIIKTLELNKWQEVTFDFKNDAFRNLDSGSKPPTERTDFNRVLIQMNGENNSDFVVAYVDDFYYDGKPSENANTTFNKLVWADEFDGNGEIDTNKWYQQTKLIAGNSWANNEQQHYTNRQKNAFVSNGTLKIKAFKEVYSDQGHQKQYTSARLNSKFSFKYGRVEVRAKLPSVAGTWPAIWLLGKNINEDGTYWDNEGFGTKRWPFCGEIDIMEPNVAKTEILGTWHWDNGQGYKISSKAVATSNADTSTNFHIYSLEWTETSMKIYLDNRLINELETINPFKEDFFILLNLAMGGSLGGNIASNFSEDTLEIDYVRVFQESSLSVKSEVKKETILIYPNPVKDYVSIKLSDNSEIENIQVFDITGKKILNTKTPKFSLKEFSKGIYLLKIRTTSGAVINKKFIKQ
ncbi:family 16 glycosylhydrolase [Polaribacter haliotis]|uniref:Family 16 glycosylhydrolase n=1 Tax=Polaribacter haliotis TaxID=1888915 RepID=A0A7L8AHM9_9FLAO|nr:family 16 glycosylhydrolase [Polaribacter haliotis]QOD61434.1 family 16 glycosylhydrolase [Polaribacter haliotis]